jgi:SAM-dependent methyltransferase
MTVLTPEDVTRTLTELSEQTWALHALAALVESGLAVSLDAPSTAAEIGTAHGVPTPLVEHLLDVIASLGLVVRDGDRFVAAPGLLPHLRDGAEMLRADLRTTLRQGANLVERARAGGLDAGWRDDDRELVVAQGVISRGLALPLRERMLPMLEGLSERLAAPGAAILDVGAGAAGGAIGFASASPTVRVVALEPAPVPLAEARRNIDAAGLADRIELRAQRIEDLDDLEQFDMAWLPQMFLPRAVFERALLTVRRALRPGGWLLTSSISRPGPELRPSLSRLRNALWGGDARFPEEVLELVRAAGYQPVLAVPMPGAQVQQPIVARRPL